MLVYVCVYIYIYILTSMGAKMMRFFLKKLNYLGQFQTKKFQYFFPEIWGAGGKAPLGPCDGQPLNTQLSHGERERERI